MVHRIGHIDIAVRVNSDPLGLIEMVVVEPAFARHADGLDVVTIGIEDLHAMGVHIGDVDLTAVVVHGDL